MACYRQHFLAFLVSALLCIGGCATLPDVSKITDRAPGDSAPRILSEKGLLPPKQSRAILDRLKESARQTDLLKRHEAVMETVSGLPLTKGNRVTLLLDGTTAYTAIFRAIESARETIDVEAYKIDDDETGRRFVDLLLKKQSEGVQVNLIYDGLGSFATPAAFFDRLRQAGVRVVEVNPLDPREGGHADHRKLVIVDGGTAITGGINISHVYASSPFRSGRKPKSQLPWRDTDIEVEGPAAAEFQRLFVDNWRAHGGAKLSERLLFPKLKEEGGALVRAIGSTPGEKNRISYISFLSALLYAEHSIHLTNAYFIPDPATLDALMSAARRGVDVKIVVPSVTDSSWALYAMRYNFSTLLKAGVKLYERKKALLHAKTAVIDGVWSTVGSTNIDYLSLSNNYEIDAVVLGRNFADEMERMFRRDLGDSREITLPTWKKRSILEKTREMFAHMFSRFM